jgi:hypothetical protein
LGNKYSFRVELQRTGGEKKLELGVRGDVH